jgi:hypothetical protein
MSFFKKSSYYLTTNQATFVVSVVRCSKMFYSYLTTLNYLYINYLNYFVVM